MHKLLVLLLVLVLVSCSWPFSKKTTQNVPAKGDKGELVTGGGGTPKPGDVRLIDGKEYIYAGNRKFGITPNEPQYQWVPKDEYAPGVFDSVAGRLTGQNPAEKKERAELQQRMAKLEEDLKQKKAPPQAAAQAQPGQGAAFSSMRLMGVGPIPVAFAYPSPKMKRRVLVLPLTDTTNYKEEHLDELTTKKLVSRLEASGAIIVADPRALDLPPDPSSPQVMKTLNELYGIQAVVKGVLSDLYASTSKVEGGTDREVSFALAKISLDIYDTETGKVLRQMSARNPFFLSRENGDMSSEKAKVKAIDLAIELIADDLLSKLLSLDWHARIASVEADKVFLNAGRLSGLQKGDVLEVYAPGVEVIDKTTSLPLGKTKGNYKGDVEVVEVFGVDASWAKITKAASFAPTDLVYLKQK
jgi:hypothetical protein